MCCVSHRVAVFLPGISFLFSGDPNISLPPGSLRGPPPPEEANPRLQTQSLLNFMTTSVTSSSSGSTSQTSPHQSMSPPHMSLESQTSTDEGPLPLTPHRLSHTSLNQTPQSPGHPIQHSQSETRIAGSHDQSQSMTPDIPSPSSDSQLAHRGVAEPNQHLAREDAMSHGAGDRSGAMHNQTADGHERVVDTNDPSFVIVEYR